MCFVFIQELGPDRLVVSRYGHQMNEQTYLALTLCMPRFPKSLEFLEVCGNPFLSYIEDNSKIRQANGSSHLWASRHGPYFPGGSAKGRHLHDMLSHGPMTYYIHEEKRKKC